MPPRARTLEITRIALDTLDECGMICPPVDSLSCLQRYSEVVFSPDLKKIEGSSTYDPVTRKCISILSRQLNGARLRWTAAHELGHVRLHLPPGSKRPRSRYEEDREAHRFARNLLMPEGWVQFEVSRLSPHGELLIARDLGILKEVFQVSWAALIRRLDELKIQERKVTEQQLGIGPPDIPWFELQ